MVLLYVVAALAEVEVIALVALVAVAAHRIRAPVTKDVLVDNFG